MPADASNEDWDKENAPTNGASMPLRRRKKKPRRKKFKPKPLGDASKSKAETSATQSVEIPTTIWIVIALLGIQILISAFWIVASIVLGNGFAMGSFLNMGILGLCIAGLIMRRSEARLIIIFISGWEILFSILRFGMLNFISNATEGRVDSTSDHLLMLIFPALIIILIVKICLLSIRDREGYFID